MYGRFFFFNDTATTEIYTLSLHDALPIRAGVLRAPLVYGTPDTWDGFRYIVLAEQFRGSIVDPFGDLPRKLAGFVDLTVQQFGPLGVVLPVAFAATVAREPRYAILTGLAAAITVFFSLSYQNADIQRYYLGPILIGWTWIAMLAATVADQVSMVFLPADDPTRGEDDVPADIRRASWADRAGPAALAALAGLAILVPTGL